MCAKFRETIFRWPFSLRPGISDIIREIYCCYATMMLITDEKQISCIAVCCDMVCVVFVSKYQMTVLFTSVFLHNLHNTTTQTITIPSTQTILDLLALVKLISLGPSVRPSETFAYSINSTDNCLFYLLFTLSPNTHVEAYRNVYPNLSFSLCHAQQTCLLVFVRIPLRRG